MFTRRNWLLRCSILINIAVILYICSHVMIGGGGNFATGPAYIIQDDVPKIRQITNAINGRDKIDSKSKDQEVIVSSVVETSQKQQQDQQKNEKNTIENNNILNDNENVGGQQQADQQQQMQDQQDIEIQEKELADDGSNGPGGGGGGGGGGVGGIGGSGNQNVGDDKHLDVPSETNDAIQEKILNVQQEQVTFVNTSQSESYVTTGDDKEFEERLKSILKCHEKDYKPETVQRGDFWVLKNYIRADHGELKCYETITYTTHADYTFLDNLVPLLERWNAPISIALHAPGTDFNPTISSIRNLRDCLPESHLVRQFVTFHIYFSSKHIPKNVPKYDKIFDQPYNCSIQAPYLNVTSGQLYKTQKKLLYPVNVGRNIARDAALTHFILASDIELYPNPGLVKKFLEMIARNDSVLQRKSPRVFPLSIFEVESASPVPKDKTELQELLRTGKAIPFHKRVCSSCHGVPKSKEWIAFNETDELGVFHIGKRVGYFIHWEPIYIGTHADPHYDERLSWEGKSDKMTQGYALCVLDYEFHILDSAFLVHKPGIKILKKDPRRNMLAAKTNQLIKKIIYPELRIMYGIRRGCAV